MIVAVINYGVGNISSVQKAFQDLGAQVVFCTPSDLHRADKIVLPGVGSFAEAMTRLRVGGWISALEDAVYVSEKPVLGICLGMQMLGTQSSEGGSSEGLNFIPGTVEKLDIFGCQLRIPHVGWNEVEMKIDAKLFEGIPDKSDFYFVHSYAFRPRNTNNLLATTSYGVDVAAVINKNNVYGCQFHPEKSSKAGRQLLNNFLRYT